ncbi:MAG: autotransporter outer membrane beta-barrel domain-containing protein, partial [Akkermansiaceae bacterium]|nr:autotransporter outer membrane beta-barrel domain-containing protein [Verrucomicrobiales bacterium]
TVTSNVILNAFYEAEINRNAVQTSDRIAARDITVNNSSLVISNSGSVPINGQSFQILQASGTISGAFSSVTGGGLPPGGTWDTSNLTVNGTIKAILPPSPVLTNVVSNGGTTLDFSWGTEYIGWRLYAQTNSLAVGLSTNWVPIEGTEGVNTYQATIEKTNAAVFYRLTYP